MRKSILLGVLGWLALSLVPASGHAQMPGEKCGGDDKVVVGTTRMASDQQNIIACLKTGDTTPGANVSEWKAMTSSGSGGGVTGGCSLFYQGSDSQGTTTYQTEPNGNWGKGCRTDLVRVDYYGLQNGRISFCAQMAAPEYACGPTGDIKSCICVKK